ncbi:gene transfer agent family protein [Tianweitania sediminis]|uniref:Gene transfer agent family protein n=1 Tax=Tianweitania sediminis TaxID=1502156 RepID=A0A8J7R246_9HYPH|nr:gene transfer agent family protein [Tianweitania sediminis]MBP0438901.1 gene transfer agent family protein [Tianweitania sediminis]HEV7416030.1 gene transfer agent family protein [Tianweitania sediminis]
MNVNKRRGEVAARLDNRDYRLCLTLGALAELESAFAATDLRALVERFSSGTLSATDMIAILGAGLRGGGNPVEDETVARMHCDDGVAGYARMVSDLLQATFGSNAPANP